MTVTGYDTDNLENRIVKIVEANWNLHGKALLASVLGLQLRREVPNFASLVPEGLIRFLESHPVVHKITYPNIPEKIGIVPLSVDISKDVLSFFDTISSERPRQLEGTHQLQAFEDNFWRAFHIPIVKRRFVVLNTDTGEFRVDSEIPGKLSEFERSIEILQSDISSPPYGTSMEEKISTTRNKISEWIERNGLAAKVFSKRTPLFRRMKYENNNNLPAMPFNDRKVTGMSKFESLSQDDLSRILIPMDIVLKLI